MASRHHIVRVQFPSGKTFDHESGRYNPGEAARTAVWVSYMDHKMYDPQTPGMARVDRLPDGWGQMSEDEKYTVATQAGYEAIAVAWYENQKLVWHNTWPEER